MESLQSDVETRLNTALMGSHGTDGTDDTDGADDTDSVPLLSFTFSHPYTGFTPY